VDSTKAAHGESVIATVRIMIMAFIPSVRHHLRTFSW
jgi:hypothetical protein